MRPWGRFRKYRYFRLGFRDGSGDPAPCFLSNKTQRVRDIQRVHFFVVSAADYPPYMLSVAVDPLVGYKSLISVFSHDDGLHILGMRFMYSMAKLT